MIFRNITAFFAPQINLFDIEAELEPHRLRDVGALELCSIGFVPPFGDACGDKLTREMDGALLLSVGRQDKILPSAAVSELLKKQVAEIEEKEGCKLGRRARSVLKDKVTTEMLPHAFTVATQTHVLILNNLVLVDTSSKKQAETCISTIRHALGTFPALPLFSQYTELVLTGWVKNNSFPSRCAPYETCELYTPDVPGESWRVQADDPRTDDVVRLCNAGKFVRRLGLTLDDAVSFTLCSDMTLRKFRIFDGVIAAHSNDSSEDIEAELNARLALMVGQATNTFGFLKEPLSLDFSPF